MPITKVSATSASPSEPALTPFWARIPKFFLWPMQFDPLVFIGMCAVGMIVASILPIIGGLLALVIWFYFFRYAMNALVQTARGNLNPEAADIVQESGDRRPIKQGVYLLVSVVSVALVVGFAGPVVGILFGLLVTVGLPAAIMIIAIHDSLADALNPVQVVGVISGIGAPYFLLCLFLMLLEGGDVAIFRLLGPLIPDLIEYPVTAFFSMYFLLVMYNMMGYVVYQYHEKLGYSVDKTFDNNAEEAPKAKAGPPLSPRDQRIADLMRDGDVKGAIEELKDDMRYNRTDINDNQKLHKLYLAFGDNDKTLPHAQQLITWLLAADQGVAALEVLQRMRGIDANFSVADASAVLPLAEAAKARRNVPLAMEMIKGFDKKNPNHRDIPAVYFLAARILSESQHDDAQAMRILQAMIMRYPEASVIKEATTYLTVLKQTSVTAAPLPRSN